jgi:hypothetical protein
LKEYLWGGKNQWKHSQSVAIERPPNNDTVSTLRNPGMQSPPRNKELIKDITPSLVLSLKKAGVYEDNK